MFVTWLSLDFFFFFFFLTTGMKLSSHADRPLFSPLAGWLVLMPHPGILKFPMFEFEFHSVPCNWRTSSPQCVPRAVPVCHSRDLQLENLLLCSVPCKDLHIYTYVHDAVPVFHSLRTCNWETSSPQCVLLAVLRCTLSLQQGNHLISACAPCSACGSEHRELWRPVEGKRMWRSVSEPVWPSGKALGW